MGANVCGGESDRKGRDGVKTVIYISFKHFISNVRGEQADVPDRGACSIGVVDNLTGRYAAWLQSDRKGRDGVNPSSTRLHGMYGKIFRFLMLILQPLPAT